jgi:hypothetical protein
MEKPGIGSPQAWLLRSRVCPEPGYGVEDLVLGAWFPRCLPQEGTGHIKFLGRNWQPSVPGVQDPDNSPQTFHQVGGRSRLLDGR